MFLLDNNQSRNLCGKLAEIIDSKAPSLFRHVGHLSMLEADDHEIYSLAKREKLIIVTRDTDFHHLLQLHGGPHHKLIYIQLHNPTKAEVIELFRLHADEVIHFMDASNLNHTLII